MAIGNWPLLNRKEGLIPGSSITNGQFPMTNADGPQQLLPIKKITFVKVAQLKQAMGKAQSGDGQSCSRSETEGD
jgi:hypothetical protein